jgi:hypothetical protein
MDVGAGGLGFVHKFASQGLNYDKWGGKEIGTSKKQQRLADAGNARGIQLSRSLPAEAKKSQQSLLEILRSEG